MRTYQTTVKTAYFIQIKIGNINIVNDVKRKKTKYLNHCWKSNVSRKRNVFRWT